METKTCTKCKNTQSIDCFSPNKGYRDHKNNWCKGCYTVYGKINRDKISARRRERRQSPEYRAREEELRKKRHIEDPSRMIWWAAKNRAKSEELPFDLKLSDITIPDLCPILEVAMSVGTMYAPSLDKIIPELGYVKGNVVVMSRKANWMKNDASLDELMKFCNNMIKLTKQWSK